MSKRTGAYIMLLVVLLSYSESVCGRVWYADASQLDDTGSGTNWASAKQTIQAAVDAAEDGDSVLVTNGVYAAGGTNAPYSATSNRVCITKRVAVKSVNGPDVTVIDGTSADGSSVGRCVYLTAGSCLSGFTVTRGYVVYGDGAGVYATGTDATISNCLLTGNVILYGKGGGSFNGTLYRCIISHNSASYGGGAYWGTLNNCVLIENSASRYGGGANASDLNNCTVMHNRAVLQGGGYYSTFNRTLNNCIVYHNTSGAYPNYTGGNFVYCCTDPLPYGPGNFTNAPHVAGVNNPHLLPGSPCLNSALSAAVIGSQDIDGEARTNSLYADVGADERWAQSLSGALAATIHTLQGRQFSVGTPCFFEVESTGRPEGSLLQFGDGSSVTNQTVAQHTYRTEGAHTVTLQMSNLTHSVSTQITVRVVPVNAMAWYVAADGDDQASGTNWLEANATLQVAVDKACAWGGGACVWVSNGVYASGGAAAPGSRLTNRVCVTNGISIQSVNGPDETFIVGSTPSESNSTRLRGVYLVDGATLSGFTVTNGCTYTNYSSDLDENGGGIFATGPAALITRCRLNGNIAGRDGGGVYSGTLTGCTIFGNDAGCGGGAAASRLEQCTLTENTASMGGGAYGSTLIACTVSSNSSSYQGGGAYDCYLNQCELQFNRAGYGGGAFRCSLTYCLLTENAADDGYGGGTYMSTVNACTLTGNSARRGGGSYYGELNNCLLTDNHATDWGGGSHQGVLNNCTLTRNSAVNLGGGTSYTTIRNCIVWNNSSSNGANDIFSSVTNIFNTCATDGLTHGLNGCITANPRFLNAAQGNYLLQADSPCINAGNSVCVPAEALSTDRAGQPRIVGNAVDMGAYEYPADDYAAAITITTTTTVVCSYAQTAVITGTSRYLDDSLHWNVTETGDGFLLPAMPEWCVEVPLIPGSNTFCIWGSNRMNAAVSDTLTLFRALPPQLTLNPPPSAVPYDFRSFYISGTQSNLSRLTWSNSFSGTSGAAGNVISPTYQFPIPLAVGTNVIMLTGQNAAFETTQSSCCIVRDVQGPVLALSSTKVTKSLLYPATNRVSARFFVRNDGGKSLDYTIAYDTRDVWITDLSPVSGTLSAGTSAEITATLNPGVLQYPGTYRTLITVSATSSEGIVISATQGLLLQLRLRLPDITPLLQLLFQVDERAVK